MEALGADVGKARCLKPKSGIIERGDDDGASVSKCIYLRDGEGQKERRCYVIGDKRERHWTVKI